MPGPQGLATFPGVNYVVGASMSFTHGISPSVCSLTIAPQTNLISTGGTLAFMYDGASLLFHGCKVDRGSFRRDRSGNIWSLQIFDRRWRWAWGAISGRYNVRRTEYTLVTDTEKTPRELAELCLDAMGETGYDVNDLPNDTRPEILWDGEVPAEALARLCDDLGCRVVLQLDNTVAIRVAGTGALLPTDGVMEGEAVIDAPEYPDEIAILCGKSLFQVDFELEMVGMDTDNTVKLLDDLSYKPAAGWSAVDFPEFAAVTASKKARRLAQETVYRWARVKCSDTYPVTIPGYTPETGDPEIKDRELIELEAEQVETVTENGRKRRRPAIVYGVWYNGVEDLANVTDTIDPLEAQKDTATDEDTKTHRSFSIDKEQRIVKFGQPLYANAEIGTPTKLTITEPTVRLRTACTILDVNTRGPVRYAKKRATGGTFLTPTRYDRHDEIILTHVPTYDASYNVTAITKNDADVDAECDYYLDAIQAEYLPQGPLTMRYAGLRAINLDGAVQQLTLAIGKSGATTVVSRSTEQANRVLPYKERRRQEFNRSMERFAKAVQRITEKRA